MLAVTTLIVAVPIVIILYFLLLNKIKYSFFNYLIIGAVGFTFILGKDLHLILIGVEVIIVGIIAIAIKGAVERKRKA